MTWILLVAAGVIFLFGIPLLFGAPYLPTLSSQTKDAITMLNMRKGQTLIELGSGDGKVLRQAAKMGINAVGYEINPLLVIISRLTTFRYRKNIQIHWKDFWQVDMSSADAIYVFLLDKYMQKLDKKIVSEIKKPTRVVSFSFAFPDRKPDEDKKGLRLYTFQPK